MRAWIAQNAALILLVALLGSLVANAVQHARILAAERDTATVRGDFREYQAATEAQARQALTQAAADRAAADQARKESDDAYQKAQQALQADRDRLRADNGRLRSAAQAYAAALNHPRGGSALEPSSPAGDASARVLADVLGEIDDFAEQVAIEADNARTHGQRCERDYDALRATGRTSDN